MKLSHHPLQAALLAAFALSWISAHAGTMTDAQRDGAKAGFSATYKMEKAACEPRKGNAKDICIEEAKAKEKVAHADLNYRDTGTAADANKLSTAKAEAAYAVAKEKCDDWSGNAKDVCVQEAKAAETKALADMKMGREIGAARTEAAEDKREADYKVAAERCDALAGDAKTSCVNAAKLANGVR